MARRELWIRRPTQAPDPGEVRWRVVEDGAAVGTRNMAVDHALARCLSRGEGVLRLYQWAKPTVSFGRNEPTRRRYDVERARRIDVEFVRRPTGGRAVLHDRELTYALVLAIQRGVRLRTVYRMANSGLVRGLASLGVTACLARADGPTPRPAAGPCFERPAEGEVTVGGRKLIGSAQARIGGAILQHGSLLVGPGQELLRGLSNEVQSVSKPICLEEVLEETPPWDVLREAVVAGLSEVLGGEWHRTGLTGRERAEADVLERHYSSEGWTWRM